MPETLADLLKSLGNKLEPSSRLFLPCGGLSIGMMTQGLRVKMRNISGGQCEKAKVGKRKKPAKKTKQKDRRTDGSSIRSLGFFKGTIRVNIQHGVRVLHDERTRRGYGEWVPKLAVSRLASRMVFLGRSGILLCGAIRDKNSKDIYRLSTTRSFCKWFVISVGGSQGISDYV